MIYTVTLNPALDYIAKTESDIIGKTNRTRDEYIVPGGKGLNVSIILSRLGMETTALGFSAGFTGAELERSIKAEGINCDLTRIPEGFTRINVKLSAKEITEYNGSGIKLTEAHVEGLCQRLASLKAGDWLVLSGSIPLGGSRDIYKRLSNNAPKGVRIVLDASGEAFLKGLEAKPFLVKPNLDELGDLFGEKLVTQADAILFGLKLKGMGAENVLISMGAEGALLINREGSIFAQKPPKGEVINTVAAGDSMIAGFIKGIESNMKEEQALKLAVAAGSATAYSPWLAEEEKISSLFALL